ncbi:MAG: hypothetical protein SFV54_02105 [Bryobacteraceae bacterium]|nr:hypothetical protein [Bryobacteraceae bacterium]
MAEPLKPPDRLKPFRRINNEESVPQPTPDGDGVRCGCHTVDEFGDMEEQFKEFIEDNLPVLGPLLKVLETVTLIARTAANAARAAAAAAAAALAAAQGSLGGPIGTVIGAILGFATALAAISSFLDEVLGVITDVLKFFIVRIGARLAMRAIRVIPQWTPVNRGPSAGTIPLDQIIEVEGTVTRSYGNPIEVPFAQWHKWMNWSIHLRPESKYAAAIAPSADNPPNTDGRLATETPIARPSSFEIQWDAGSLLEGFGDPFETGFKADDMPKHDGPWADGEWLWPMTGMFVWASGRWVYDCSKTKELKEARNPKTMAMMNPPRAIATASWEAVQFAENLSGDPKAGPTRVPAIKFMFFACKRGGYMKYSSLAEKDYEFIVDLPPIEAPVAPFPIGATTEFFHNTIVLRPRLLQSTLSLPHAGAALIKPIVQLLPPEKPGDAPKQAKITITKASLEGKDAAGVMLSLGWHDPNRTQAKKVKVCQVAFSGITGRIRIRDNAVKQVRDLFKKEEEAMRKEIADRVANIKILGLSLNDIPIVKIPPNGPTIDLGGMLKDMVRKAVDAAIDGFFTELGKIIAGGVETEEWLMRVGVNGRWNSRYFDKMDKGPQAIKNPPTFEIFLGPEDFLFFSGGGVEFNNVGDMMLAPISKRQITRNDQPVSWNDLVTATGTVRRDFVFQYALKTLVGNKGNDLLALGIENTPLGIFDPDFTKPDVILEVSNPITMKNLQPETASRRQKALFARATGEEFILVEDSAAPDDYIFDMLISVRKQIP